MKELAPVTTEIKKSQICIWQASDSGELLKFQIEFKGLRTRRPIGVNSVLKAIRLKNQKELVFQSKFEDRKRPVSCSNSQAEGVPS